MPSSSRPSRPPARPPTPRKLRLLITAGPTHEPIDAVRYIANRSSGRLGLALADSAASRGCAVTLLLGPTHLRPSHSNITLLRFRTTAELQALLQRHARAADVLIMAAAVADYRPASALASGKVSRASGGLTLRLQSTPDLLAECASRRRPGQCFVGFALEPRARLLPSARRKLLRKGIDLIVANPLETMESPRIKATVLSRSGVLLSTPRAISKTAFARRLVAAIQRFASAGAGKR